MAEISEVGSYRLKERIGRGGMAEVFRAEDPRTQRDVAVKIISREIADDPTFRKRFAQEISLIARLEHSAIVPLYDVGEVEGRPYLVMRYMPNGSLAERIEAGPIPLVEASRLMSRVAAALDFAHGHGIVHRDLKPGNILLDRQGEAHIADFGIAKIMDQSGATLSRTGMTMGTPAYMSPEQFRGEHDLDGRADVYALGVLLFQMLSGKLPFDASTPHGLMYQHLESPVPDIRTLNPDIPADLHIVLQQALAKQRDNRYASAGDFARDVQAVAEGKTITPLPSTSAAQLLTVPLATRTPPMPPVREPVRERKKRPVPWVAIAFTGAAILLAGSFLLAPRFFGFPPADGAPPEALSGDAVPPEATHTHTEPQEVVGSEDELTEEPAATGEPLEDAPVVADLPATENDFVIYSDYLEEDFEDWSWAPVGVFNDEPVYEGDYSVWVEFVGDYDSTWFINPEGAVGTADYVALRFAIHGGDEGGQIMLIGANHDEEFPEDHRVQLEEYLPGGPVPDAWREVTIPLVDLGMEDSTLYSVTFQNDLEEGQPELYIDDIRLIANP